MEGVVLPDPHDLQSSVIVVSTCLLAAGLLAAPPSAAADTLLTPPGGPRILAVATPGRGATALRVSVPVTELEEGEAGALEVIRHLAVARAAPLAERVGARLVGTRTPWGLAYTVSGSDLDLDHLASILRQALAPPEPHRLGDAVRTLATELDRAEETPGGVLRARLRERVLPGDDSPSALRASLERLDARTVEEVWARSHRREELTVVAVGPAIPEVVLASVREISSRREEPSAGAGAATLPSVSPPDTPQVLRHWYGLAFPVDGGDPRAAVVAALVSRTLRENPGSFEASVELVERGPRAALLVTGAAYPGSQAELRTRLDGIRSEVRDELTAEGVARAVVDIERDLVAATGTPWGLADFLGRELERGGDGHRPERYLEELREVDEGGVRAFLDALDAPAAEEFRP